MLAASGLHGCGVVGSSAARRRRLRRLRFHWNREQLTVRMAAAAATHHGKRCVTSSIGMQTGCTVEGTLRHDLSEVMEVVNVPMLQEKKEQFSGRNIRRRRTEWILCFPHFDFLSGFRRFRGRRCKMSRADGLCWLCLSTREGCGCGPSLELLRVQPARVGRKTHRSKEKRNIHVNPSRHFFEYLCASSTFLCRS